MKLPYDLLTQNYTRPRVYLCEVDKQIICELEAIDMSASLKFNAYSELTFTVNRTYMNMVTGETLVNPFYDKIEALRLIYLDGFGYFEIQEPEIFSDGIKETKTITAYSLDYRLSQRYLENFKINTGEADSLEVIEAGSSRVIPITLLNNVKENLSLLDLALEKVYDWKIGYVDDSLKTMSRQFDVSRESVYDFIVQDICEKFNCYAVFDTIDNKINLYAESLITKHIGDGTSDTFVVPSTYDSIDTVTIDSYKTTKYKHYIKKDEETGKETSYITFDTPPKNGARIEITDGSQTKWQTDVYVTFDNLAQEVKINYSADDIKTVLSVKGQDDLDIREVNMGLPYIVDISYYYTVDWMGKDLYDAYTKYLQTAEASQSKYAENSEKMLEITGYIIYETQRLSLQYSIADNVNSTTVGTYYVRGGTAPNYYYKEVKLPDEYNSNIEHYYMLSGSDLDEDKFSKLYAALQTYFVSKDNKDVSEITKLKENFAFIETYTVDTLISNLSNATNLEEKNMAILSFFDEMWNQLGKTPLKTLYLEPYQKIESTNKEAGWNDTSNENYWRYYPVTLVIQSLENEIKDRETIIEEYQTQYSTLQEENKKIANGASIYNNFTHEQLVRLSPFLREDEYTDDNFVETDSDTIEIIMETKQELLECGKIELSKLCEPKLSFSMDMANIYALKEFEPIIHQFQLGKLINVVIRDDYIKKARLLAVDINFDDFSDFSCEFGELSNLKTPSNIHADLLANALSAGKSVASNQSYWEKGAELAISTDIKIQNGLLNAIDGIYNADKSVLIDNHGILLRQVLDNGEYSPYQIWLTNNNILVSTDAFQSAQTGIGVFEVDGKELYGVLAKAILSGYVESSTIVGGTINIGDGTFVVDEFGNVTMNAASINGYVAEDSIISSINQSAEAVTINANKVSLAGKNIDLTSDNITISSTNFNVTKDGTITAKNADISGKITASDGAIAGWSIGANSIYKTTTVDNISYNVYMQATNSGGAYNAFCVRTKNADVASWTTQFSVNYAGKLTAKNANIAGTITATDGSIAGYNIGSGGSYDNAIYKRITGNGTGYDYEVGLKSTSGNEDLAFYVKRSSDGWASSSNVFYVNNSGKLYAKNADVSGKITASEGSIGSWTIGDMGKYTNSIYSTYCAASSPSNTNPEYAVFMRGTGEEDTIAIGVKKRTSSSTDWAKSDTPFYVRKDGYVKMGNADVTGAVNAESGTISGNLEISGALTHTRGNYKVTLRGVQSTLTNGVFYITDSSSGSDKYPVRINGDGSASFTNVEISGSSTIAAACIPNLSASKITSGTLSSSRIDTSTLTIKSGCTIGSGTYNAKISSYDQYYAALSADASGNTSYTASLVSVVRAAQAWSSNNSSNKNIKNNIHDFDDRYDVLFDNLRPQLYKYNSRPDDGYSMGYIWQEVNESLAKSNLTRNDVGAVYEDKFIDGGLGLRKTDFIALNTWQIQKLKTRIEELENRLSELERNDKNE